MGGLFISATGIINAIRRQDIIANNIANLATPGFRASRADFVDVLGGGVDIGSITRGPGTDALDANGEITASGALTGSNVNLATEMTNMIANRHTFQANINAFKVQADLIGELLDISR